MGDSNVDRAQEHVRQVGEQLGKLVKGYRDGGTDRLLDDIENISAGRRTVLLAAAVQLMVADSQPTLDAATLDQVLDVNGTAGHWRPRS